MFRVLIIIMSMLRTTISITAYQCNTTDLQYTTVSLVDMPTCRHNANKNTIKVEEEYVIQKTDNIEIDAYRCRIKFHRLVHNCDYLGSSEAVEGDDIGYNLDITKDRCNMLIQKDMFVTNKGAVKINLRKNRENIIAETVAGETYKRGRCTGATYNDIFGKWTNVVTATYTVEYSRIKVTFDLGNNKIVLPSGIETLATDEECVDKDEAKVFWEAAAQQNCWQRGVYMLYEGPVYRISETEQNYNYIFINATQDHTMSLKLSEVVTLCGVTGYNTIVPEVLYIPKHEGYGISDFKRTSTSNIKLNLNFLTQLNGVDIHLSGELTRLYQEIRYNDCTLQRKILKMQLHLGFTNPLEFAYLYNDGPGATAIQAGEVIHIAKCTAIQVELRKTEKCYRDIPITNSKKAVFMDSRNKIIKEHGIPVPCTKYFDTLLKIDELWYNINPTMHTVQPPKSLQTDLKSSWAYNHYDRIIKGGLYTQAELNKAYERLQHGYRIEAIAGSLNSQIMQEGVDINNIKLNKLIDMDGIRDAVEGQLEWAWTKAKIIGNVTTGILGIYVIYEITTTLLGVIINGLLIHRHFGRSWRLLGALFSSIGNAILHNQHRQELKSVKKIINEKRKGKVNRTLSQCFKRIDNM